MQHQGFGKHGQLGRAELVLPVMADDQVLDRDFQIVGEIRHLRKLAVQHLQLDHHVPEQLALGGVAERACIGEFANLADVVQERSGQQQVPVHQRIIARHQVADAAERNHVFEQAADECVVQGFRRWGIAVAASDLRIGHEGSHQRPQMRLLDAGHELA